MINSSDCYLEAKSATKSILDYFFRNNSKINWTQTSPGIEGIFLDQEQSDLICEQNDFLSKITKIVNITNCGFLKFEPNSWLQWHTDGGERHTVINCLITPETRSFCFFLEDISKTSNFIELHYKKDCFYLFNAQMFHTVVNLDQPRYMFSASIVNNNNPIPYNESKILLKDLFK